MKTIKQLIKEVFEISDLEGLKETISYKIHKDNKENLWVSFSPIKSELEYQLKIERQYENGDKNHPIYWVEFGIKKDGYVDTNSSGKDPYKLSVMKAVFSFLRYYLDKYKINKFYYHADDLMRYPLYNNGFKKNFSDYKETVKDLDGKKSVTYNKI